MSRQKEAPLPCCGFKNTGLAIGLNTSQLSGELCRKPARRLVVKVGGLEIAVPICAECEKIVKGELPDAK